MGALHPQICLNASAKPAPGRPQGHSKRIQNALPVFIKNKKSLPDMTWSLSEAQRSCAWPPCPSEGILEAFGPEVLNMNWKWLPCASDGLMKRLGGRCNFWWAQHGPRCVLAALQPWVMEPLSVGTEGSLYWLAIVPAKH